ncbi:unnamed protein product [Chrysoparadoxa australica]
MSKRDSAMEGDSVGKLCAAFEDLLGGEAASQVQPGEAAKPSGAQDDSKVVVGQEEKADGRGLPPSPIQAGRKHKYTSPQPSAWEVDPGNSWSALLGSDYTERGGGDYNQWAQQIWHSSHRSPPPPPTRTAQAAQRHPTAGRRRERCGSPELGSATQVAEGGHLTSVRLLVPNFIAGRLIGHGGQSIREIQANSGAAVRISTSGVYFPGTQDRVVLVTGKHEEVKAMCRVLLEKIHQHRDHVTPALAAMGVAVNPFEMKVAQKFLIPVEAAGVIIGCNGANIKSLSDQTGACISLSQKFFAVGGERIVKIHVSAVVSGLGRIDTPYWSNVTHPFSTESLALGRLVSKTSPLKAFSFTTFYLILMLMLILPCWCWCRCFPSDSTPWLYQALLPGLVMAFDLIQDQLQASHTVTQNISEPLYRLPASPSPSHHHTVAAAAAAAAGAADYSESVPGTGPSIPCSSVLTQDGYSYLDPITGLSMGPDALTAAGSGSGSASAGGSADGSRSGHVRTASPGPPGIVPGRGVPDYSQRWLDTPPTGPPHFYPHYPGLGPDHGSGPGPPGFPDVPGPPGPGRMSVPNSWGVPPFHSATDFGGHPVSTIMVAVSDQAAGVILGRAGATVAQIQNRSRARLSVSHRGQAGRPSNRNRIVVIQGDPEATQTALSLINQMVVCSPVRWEDLEQRQYGGGAVDLFRWAEHR